MKAVFLIKPGQRIQFIIKKLSALNILHELTRNSLLDADVSKLESA
jgi:hypothetical protein